MSRSTLLAVYKTKAEWELELPNSYGTAPLMWDFFYEKHCWDGNGWSQSIYGQGGATTFLRPFAVHHHKECLDEVCAKLDDTSVPLRHRAGLFLTYDRVILRAEDLPELVEEFRILAFELRGYAKPNHANHWEKIADYVSEKAKRHDPRMLGIALNCTSVRDVWDDYPDDTGIKCTSEFLFKPKAEARVESQN